MKLARYSIVISLVACSAPTESSAGAGSANSSSAIRSAQIPNGSTATPPPEPPLALSPAARVTASPATRQSKSTTPTERVDFERERALIDESTAARRTSDYVAARVKAFDAVTSLLARPKVEQDGGWLSLLDAAGRSAREAQDARTAELAFRQVLEIRSAALPDDHPDLQRARENLAGTIADLGDLAAARTLEEQVLAVRERTLPDDDPDLQHARQNLAVTIEALGDLAGARALEEKVLDVCSRTLPDDHPALQAARNNLAVTIEELGDLAGARALQEKVLAIDLRTLPDDHPDLQMARENLALTIEALGDLAGARLLQEKALEVRARTLADDHPDLQAARQNLAITIAALGDLADARSLFEKVLEVNARTLPDDHPDLQTARNNLAVTIERLGDLAGARTLFEKVLEIDSRTLPDDHPELQRARQNLAVAIRELGDAEGAKVLEEKVLQVRSATLPDDHPDVQKARQNLAVTMGALGDAFGARTLFEKVLEIRARLLPDDHPDLQRARGNLAGAIEALGDLAGARTLFEKVLEVDSRTLPDDDLDLQGVRQRLAEAIVRELPRARRSIAADDARARATSEVRARCVDLIGAVCRAQVHAARLAIVASPAREAEERCSSLAKQLGSTLSFALGYGVFTPLRELEVPCFVLSETTRGAALASTALARGAVHSPKYGELRDALRTASASLAELAQAGTTSAEFDRARVRRESLERELVALAREISGESESAVQFDVESLAARLAEREAAVSFRCFTRTRLDVTLERDSIGEPTVAEVKSDNLCAFVVRSSKAGAPSDAARAVQLALVDLGPIEPIEAAARAWREAIGAGLERGLAVADSEVDRADEYGEELRRLVFDPLLPALGDAERVGVVLDDVLLRIPLEALPLAATTHDRTTPARVVGDRWRIETRATLAELMRDSPTPNGAALVALGGASFNLHAVALSSAELASIEATARGEKPVPLERIASSGEVAPADERAPPDSILPLAVSTRLRGTVWERGFTPLTHAGDEARGVGELYEECYGDERPVLVLEKRKASRAALEAVAPKARFIHIATHGWFAPESVKSWNDAEPLDKQSGFGMRMSGMEQVKGMSPMLLCGLAFAGANLPENEIGRAPGLITAEEISALDLSNCELAVLSACDTNVGERRAGQGVHSLQMALQMAGARSVITSLWKVPDEATKDLMLDFYRRLWVEKKPKWQALWEAKKKLRAAKDEKGNPSYSTRDWAAWVLTGDPN